MMLRILLLSLVACGLPALASDPIAAPYAGASVSASGPHVTAELIPEKTGIEPGGPFDVALHLHMDPGWHTYWINPGDAGLATTITWTLPPGFTAGPIQWPTPEKHNMGPLVTYGYEGDVYLLTTITPPKGDLPRHFDISAKTTWLVCKEECIPGKADLTLHLDGGLLNLRLPVDNTNFFKEARKRLPVPNTRWIVKGAYGSDVLTLTFREKISAPIDGKNVYFFPEQGNVLSANEDKAPLELQSDFTWPLALQQNGEKPDHLSGVLVYNDMFTMPTHPAVYISEFPVALASGSPATTGVLALSGSLQATGGSQQTAAQRAAATTAPPFLLAVFGSAFVGGLILNLMPCVLPVLSLKVFALVRHAGENPGAAWRQGAAFTAGVVISFWVLAGLLLALRAAGNHLGWGFQMQSPGFVLALIFLFFLLALNLFGVFEVGASLVGLDAKATSHASGLTSSFLNGALATLAATPCTAPYMGWALGVAAQQSAAVALLIFTFLALGMAAPYLLLTIFPGALRFVPKPGAWMEAVRQFMGFLLMGTVIFLIYVFGALVGEGQVPGLLFVLLLAGVAAWIYGRWGVLRTLFFILALATIYIAAELGLFSGEWRPISEITFVPRFQEASRKMDEGWQPWSPEAVSAALAQGRPVFVDFTAAWCLSCKVNEALALGTDAVKQAFADKKVALFRADWTHYDPAISTTLQKYNRDGVPLYLLYSPKGPDTPQVLPEALTPGIVLEALSHL